MKIETIIALIIGTVAMYFLMFALRKFYGISSKKLLVVAPFLTIAGAIGACLLYFVENFEWGGISFYGSILLIPILFIPFALLIKTSYGDLMDLCAPSVCVMLAINKVNCVVTGCCKGMILYTNADGNPVRFPSQIVELVTALLIMVCLILMIRKRRFRGSIYAWLFIIYGVSRSLLNLLRETKPFVWIIPAGNFWSIVAIAAGILWIILAKKAKGKRTR